MSLSSRVIPLTEEWCSSRSCFIADKCFFGVVISHSSNVKENMRSKRNYILKIRRSQSVPDRSEGVLLCSLLYNISSSRCPGKKCYVEKIDKIFVNLHKIRYLLAYGINARRQTLFNFFFFTYQWKSPLKSIWFNASIIRNEFLYRLSWHCTRIVSIRTNP